VDIHCNNSKRSRKMGMNRERAPREKSSCTGSVLSNGLRRVVCACWVDQHWMADGALEVVAAAD
jgi:hypothetical protein